MHVVTPEAHEIARELLVWMLHEREMVATGWCSECDCDVSCTPTSEAYYSPEEIDRMAHELAEGAIARLIHERDQALATVQSYRDAINCLPINTRNKIESLMEGGQGCHGSDW